ncbi:hypothetical protein [Winogradskyella sp. A3E31]|uniref:hypothetical protein n=1 Tax=Winogradskyella sp. A3E31 TaxID=3349637 RepID=UPI00398AB8B9
MKQLFFSFFLLANLLSAQDNITLKSIDSTLLNVKSINGIDNFGTLYYTTKDNSFIKRTTSQSLNYSNFQLGDITSSNPFNPLKINVFYKDFNTVILLDNRLAEISKLDFNQIEPFRNVSHVSTGYDSTIWIFNQDTQQLELFDYLILKTKLKTIPVRSQVLDLKSNYNYCYMLTENFLYIYNYFGSLITKVKNEGYTEIGFTKGSLFLKKENQLSIFNEETAELKELNHPNLLIKQFLVTNETLYIYDGELLRRYQLKNQ